MQRCNLFNHYIRPEETSQEIGFSFKPYDRVELLPPIAGELLPESETRFFERLIGTPVTFSHDDHGKVTGLTVHYVGDAFSTALIDLCSVSLSIPACRPLNGQDLIASLILKIGNPQAWFVTCPPSKSVLAAAIQFGLS